MKAKRKVISRKNFGSYPQKMIWVAGLVWLYLDKYNAPGWLIGALAALGLLFLAAGIAVAFEQDEVDIFELRQ